MQASSKTENAPDGIVEETALIASDPATRFHTVRDRTVAICAPLRVEDHVVQPVVDVSPPKWHLGHTTWFFEQFILKGTPGYKLFNDDMAFMFNSYYETVGKRMLRADRGNMTRPTLDEVHAYRAHVDKAMETYLSGGKASEEVLRILELGLNHEEQHQELLMTDLKFILGNNPLFPKYDDFEEGHTEKTKGQFIEIAGGLHSIGFKGPGFSFDNEHARHQVYLNDFAISDRLVTNGDFLTFMDDVGYEDFKHWHSDGWQWVRDNKVQAPMYWHKVDGTWHYYTLKGLTVVEPKMPLCHISYYEAFAFAEWKGMRLPTEAEWEVASDRFQWGQRWEWTNSAYLAYPGYKRVPGALGEYNGKFMVNQMVLRGASVATAPDHSRASYRNFFQPELRWQYTGLRLAK
ncbi:MAG: ergothioneine biosynthesis protein EgtB [Flavobacteriales bacterium]|jgi:ergothioneine biosynthesis protein EgtB|nr:ergothioneine biosynthesis protein EgtB [Flavobacteriales bacterium]